MPLGWGFAVFASMVAFASACEAIVIPFFDGVACIFGGVAGKLLR